MKKILNFFFSNVFNGTILAQSVDITAKEIILDAKTTSNFKKMTPRRLKSGLNPFQRKSVAHLVAGIIVLDLYWFNSVSE